MTVKSLTKADFKSDQVVRWCPGCGDYAILSAVQGVMPKLGIAKEKMVFISGIGCSSRFPYYMDTYGFHTIHGRAPSFATGLKASNPDLSIWMVTGDGDGLSIGGNHLLHVLRRNPDINILLFNNRIYGLTKGQYSPTSEIGKQTKSSPMGSIDAPINPIRFALAAEASFVARTYDTNVQHMGEIFQQAAAHKGTSFIEIYQNCVIFNKDPYDEFYDRKVRSDEMIHLEEGQFPGLWLPGEKRLVSQRHGAGGMPAGGCRPKLDTAGPRGQPAFENLCQYVGGTGASTISCSRWGVSQVGTAQLCASIARPSCHGPKQKGRG